MRTGENIRQRSDGRYEARYPKGRDGRGRLVYGSCYGRTYEEAAEKRETLLREARPVREMNLLILGAGSHGREVRELAESLRVFQRTAFLDDDPAKEDVLGPISALGRYVEEFPAAIPAVGSSARRLQWLNALRQVGFALPVLIHPGAVVSPSAEIGYGSVICARATVGAGAVIGHGCIISSGVTIDRGVVLPAGIHVEAGRTVTAETVLK